MRPRNYTMKRAIFGFAAAALLALPVLALAPMSGLQPGEMTSAFEPTHIAGPDKGTETCPVCKYGNRPAIQVWNTGDDQSNIVAMLNHLDNKVANSKHELKAFEVRVTSCEACVSDNGEIAKMVKGGNVGITQIPSTSEAVKAYKINTDGSVKNTVIVYRNRKVVANFVNLKADEEGLAKLDAAIAKVDN